MRLFVKISLLISFIALTIGLLSLLVVRGVMSRIIESNIKEDALIIAQTVGESITSQVINGEVVAVHDALLNVVSRTKDVGFAYVTGFGGEVFAHSFPGGFPKALLTASGRKIPHGALDIERLSIKDDPILKAECLLVPGMRAAIHIGMREKPMYDQLRNVRNRVVGITLVVTILGILLGIVMSRRITRPLGFLADTMRSFGEGKIRETAELPASGGREVHELALSFNRMIEERSRAEEALRLSEEQLRQSQKMEAIGKLAGGIAHDFNNLLTVILGYSTLLLTRFGGDDPSRREVDEIRKAGERAAALTDRLLAFSRRKVLKPKTLDLNVVLANMDLMLRRVIGEDIDLVIVPAAGLGAVRVDPGQIEQVIVNLAVNARDAMPRGGKLTIETANVPLDDARDSQVAGVPPGPFVKLSVTDTGCGMSDEVKSRLFEPFFTTKENGTGLGLSSSFGFVKQSGGDILVDSETGRGTTVKMFLPRVEGAREERQPEESLSAPEGGSETIFLVEDEDGVRDLAREILLMNRYNVLEARDGVEAMRISALHEGEIHLMVTDVVMPRMGGQALAERLAPLRPGMKVLYMSGHMENAIAHHGLLDPAVAFLSKPFTPRAFARKVRETLDASPVTPPPPAKP